MPTVCRSWLLILVQSADHWAENVKKIIGFALMNQYTHTRALPFPLDDIMSISNTSKLCRISASWWLRVAGDSHFAVMHVRQKATGSTMLYFALLLGNVFVFFLLFFRRANFLCLNTSLTRCLLCAMNELGTLNSEGMKWILLLLLLLLIFPLQSQRWCFVSLVLSIC